MLICDALGLTYTELNEQPEEWINGMLLAKTAKNKVIENQTKKQQG